MKNLLLLLLMFLDMCDISAQDQFFYDGAKKCALTRHVSTRSASEAYIDANGTYMELTGSIYVKLKSLDDKVFLDTVAKKYGLTVVKQSEFLPLWFVLRAGKRDASVLQVANEIYETGRFAVCRPDFAIDAREISYDPDVLRQWGLYNSGNPYDDTLYDYVAGVDINASPAWNYSTGRGVVIAIVDEGIDMTHEDLKSNIYPESLDTQSEDTLACSNLYGDHGTHCAGIAAAVRNNGIQVSGVAPDARLMSVSNDLSYTPEEEFNLARGIVWAAKHGADIISCSWRCTSDSSAVADAIRYVVSKGRNGKGCVVVKSAGNNGVGITAPGNDKSVIAVGNIMPNGFIADDSNHGENMLVCAPGTSVLSTIPHNQIKRFNGTSMAAPHVAGVVALMLERNPELSVAQVREILAKSARKLNTMNFTKENEYGLWNEYYGYGLVDALNAVLMSIDYKNK